MKRNSLISLISLIALIVFIVINVAFTFAVTETPNDPTVNPDANACYTGGSMAGTCDTDYLWIAGWYAIRLQWNVITAGQVPDAYKWLIDNVPIVPTVTEDNVPAVTEDPNIFPTNPLSVPTIITPAPTDTLMLG